VASPVELKIGQVVLVARQGGDAFSQQWMMGRILEIHRTKGDGQVRMIKVKTVEGQMEVGLNRVALMEDLEEFGLSKRLELKDQHSKAGSSVQL
jgi:hypothetical protein